MDLAERRRALGSATSLGDLAREQARRYRCRNFSDCGRAMTTQRRIISIAGSGLLLLTMSAARFAGGRSHDLSSPRVAPEACSLLSGADASRALEVSSVSSKRLMDSDPSACVWSNDPAASDSSRRVVVVTHTPRAFQAALHPAITTIKVEPVSGIGEEYQIYPKDSPFIWVRKGNTAISIRVMTRKPSPFTVDQAKAKVAVLAKAVVAKL